MYQTKNATQETRAETSIRGAPSGVSSDRLSDIDALLSGSPPPSPQSVQVAYARPPAPATVQHIATIFQPRVWLQLASGTDADDFTGRFRRMKARNPGLFDGIKPYVARSADGARLVVGPFRGSSDADIFAEDLQSIGISPMKWANSQSDRIAPLPGE